MARPRIPHKDGKKFCPDCKVWKPFIDWGRGVNNWDGLRTYCKECATRQARAAYASNIDVARRRTREYSCRKRYGISLAEAEAMRAAGCAVCGTREEKAQRQLSIDHCHETGKVRGVLCFACNTALGKMGDDPERIRALAAYVEA